MSSSSNPFGAFNLTDMLKFAQDNPMTKNIDTSELLKSVTNQFFKSDQPKDLGELWDMQKQNLALLADKDKAMSTKMMTLALKQQEVFQEAWKTYEHYTKKAAEGVPVDKGAMQTAQDAMLKAMTNMQELGQQNAKISTDAAGDLQKRMTDSVSELQSLLKQFGPK